jgi:hypothetical protein
MSDQEIIEYAELKQPMAMGDVFVKSGLFPDVKSQAQAVVKIIAGKELGLTPFQSMSGIYFVNGKLALQVNVLSGLVRKSKKYDYKVLELTDEICKIEFIDITEKEPKQLGISIFGKLDAAKAGLANKDNYKNYARNMYFARAFSNGARWFCPDAIQGYYSYEEMQDTETISNEPIKQTVTIEVPVEVTNATQA